MAVFSGVAVVFDRTVELDVGKAINARRVAVNPDAANFSGPIKLVIRGDGGFGINPFGRHTVAVEGIQAKGKARYRSAVDWR